MKKIAKYLPAAVVVVALLSLACAPEAEPGAEGEPGVPEDVPPEDGLPFAANQVASTWDVGGGRLLVETVEAFDHTFFLYDAGKEEAERIVWPVESATYRGQEGDHLTFIARGGDDTGNYAFPYLLRYDLRTGELAREPMFVPADRPVAFGKSSWKQVLKHLEVSVDGLVLDFVPHEGEVLAGGHCRPVTVIRQDGRDNSLVVRLYNVVVGEDVAQMFAESPEGRISLTPAEGAPAAAITMLGLDQGPGVPVPDEDARVLGEGFPFGHIMTDPSHLEGQPVAEVRLWAGTLSSYCVEFPPADEKGESVIRYFLKTR